MIYIYIFKCIYSYVYICMSICICIYLYVYIHSYVYSIRIYAYSCVNIIYIYVFICVYKYTYVYMNMCIYIYICKTVTNLAVCPSEAQGVCCWWSAFDTHIHWKMAPGMPGYNGPQLRGWTRNAFPRLRSAQTLSHWKAVGVSLKPSSKRRPGCIRKDCEWLKDLQIVHASSYKQHYSYCNFSLRGSTSNPIPRRQMSHPFCWWQITMLVPIKYLDCLWLQ